jgi:hypothetical protein
MPATVTPGSLITVVDRVVGAELDGEYVMLDPESGCYFGLNEVGSVVWQFLDRPRRLTDIVAHVCSRFDVSAERCTADVTVMIQELAARRLVDVSDAPAPAET